ncbi:MAG: hypothetical protein PHH85_02255 [Candidatus Methanoperedens sp.]|nr:hypothetical protein [Candidatus Methanoperedens sp.]
MTLETSEVRVKLLKAGFTGKEIEVIHLCQTDIKTVEGNVLLDPWQKHPDGKTCAHCQHYTRCARLISRQGDEDVCDWAPSRFEPRVTEDIVCL